MISKKLRWTRCFPSWTSKFWEINLKIIFLGTLVQNLKFWDQLEILRKLTWRILEKVTLISWVFDELGGFCRWTRELSKLNLEIIFLLILVHKKDIPGKVFGDQLLFDGKIEINSKKLRWSPRFLSSTRFEPGCGLMTHPVMSTRIV